MQHKTVQSSYRFTVPVRKKLKAIAKRRGVSMTKALVQLIMRART